MMTLDTSGPWRVRVHDWSPTPYMDGEQFAIRVYMEPAMVVLQTFRFLPALERLRSRNVDDLKRQYERDAWEEIIRDLPV